MASVVVVGGGIAGLVCAWRLVRAGHDVEVLDQGEEPGGRIGTAQLDGRRIPHGAGHATSAHRNLVAVATALDLSATRKPGIHGAVLRDGCFEPADLDSPLALLRSDLLSTPAVMRLAGLGLAMFRHRAQLDPTRPERALALDAEGLHTFLTRTVGAEARDFVMAPAVRRSLASEPADLSAAALLLALRFAADGHERIDFDGGLVSVVRALADAVPVRRSVRVTSVETETDGARVRYTAGDRNGSVVADAVVVAVPAPLVPELCPKLTPSERGFLETVEYAPALVTHFALGRPVSCASETRFVFPESERIELAGVEVDASARRISATSSGSAIQRLRDVEDAGVAAQVEAEIARTPIGRLDVRAVAVHRWAQAQPRFGTGALARLAAFQRRNDRSPRLAFAGDYLIGTTVEAALTSGMRAASESVRALE